MKIGIIGLGSIGRKHVYSLKKLGYSNIISLRSRKGALKDLPEDLNYIEEVYNPSDFFLNNLDGVIISNPTSLHIKSMKLPLEKKIPIFLEKPIAGSLEQTKEIERYDKSKIMVGFCLRYSEIINITKDFLDSGKLGRIYKANLYCGQYLPSWHTYTDYKLEYYSKKNLGGGVIRTLSHEIDLMHYFFGNVKELCASIEKISDLEIDVDDNAYIICKMYNKSLVCIELDYLNSKNDRKGIIFGSEGILQYSFKKLNVRFTDLNGKVKIIYENPYYDSNQMYIDQMNDFINLLKNKNNFRPTFKDGLNVMKVIQAAESSTKNKNWKKIKSE